VVTGLGVVGLGLGTVFGLEAKGKYNDSLDHCEPGNPNLCDDSGISQRNSARAAGNISTVAFGVGAAALVGGIVIWLTAPGGGHASAVSLLVAPTPGGAVVRGAW
jgi:hypothetical protein